MAESELDKQTNFASDLKRKIEELQLKADEAARLKDQLDEQVKTCDTMMPILFILRRYRHAADKLQKTENVMEKYKKKLQEGADLRQHVRVSAYLPSKCISSTFSFPCLGTGEAKRRPR